MSSLAIGSFLLGLTSAVQAAETIPFSPEQIVSNAVAYSLQLKASEQEIKAAEARQKQAQAQSLPRLSADARAYRYSGLKDSAFGPLLQIPAIESRYGAGVSVNQPAFTGGRLKSQREGAVLQKSAAWQSRRAAEAEVILRALQAYWQWSKAYYSLTSLRAAVARMEAHAQDMRHRHQAGLATDNDTLATDVLVEQTRLRLEDALRQTRLASARLAVLTGQNLPSQAQPDQAKPLSAMTLPAEEELLQNARTIRAERTARQLEAKAAETLIKSSRADYYPQLSLTARYEQARPNVLNIPPRDRWEDDGFIGATLSWNLFDWGLTRAKVAEAKARAAQARLRVQEIEDQITLEAREAGIQVQDARERIQVAGRAEQSARRNVEAVTTLWQNGLARHAEVLDAHAQLTTAEFDAIAARTDLLLARAALEHAVGRRLNDE